MKGLKVGDIVRVGSGHQMSGEMAEIEDLRGHDYAVVYIWDKKSRILVERCFLEQEGFLTAMKRERESQK
jgi:hypothetical protein